MSKVTVGVMNMEQSEQPINITSALKALSPWLNNPRRTVLRIEVFTAIAAVLLFFQLIFGSFRRRTHNLFIQGVLWLAYTLLPPLITYTLGLMQSSPVKSGLYPVWAISLFLFAGGANSITAYDLDDNKHWIRRMFDIVLWYIYCNIIFRLLYPGDIWSYYFGLPKTWPLPIFFVIFLLIVLVFYANCFGTLAGRMSNNSLPSKVVADYMKEHADSIVDSQGFNPVSMRGCKYLVWWSGSTEVQRVRRLVHKLAPGKQVITVEMVWAKFNEYVFNSHGLSSRIKGACLSYSLSHLLRRRFFGMDCAEIGLPETRKFVYEGLLSESNSDEYTKAFKVIEVELGFLYDLFFTKYAFIFEIETLVLLMVILKIMLTSSLGLLLLFKSPAVLQPEPIIEVGTRTTDTVITVVVLGAFLVVEIMQIILYLGSDWSMVSLACNHISAESPKLIPFQLRKTFGFLSRCSFLSYWQNKIGQYSIIEGSQVQSSSQLIMLHYGPQNLLMTPFMFLAYIQTIFWNAFSRKGVHFVNLPDILKPEVISALKSNRDGLTNGKASLQRNKVFERFSWTLQNETQTVNMLIWHIATECCRITLCDVAEAFAIGIEERNKPISSYQYREVATKISCYCAYLMYDVPELLPGESEDTRCSFNQAMHEARKVLGTKMRNGCLLLEAITGSIDENTIFAKGLQLGRELANMGDSYKRWRLMAEFWAETILYIAPSDNARAHMERLAKGGEFLTHIWALLTHAGILIRPPSEMPNTRPDPEEGTT